MSKKLSRILRRKLEKEQGLLLSDIQDMLRSGDEGGVTDEGSMHTKQKKLGEIKQKLRNSK